MKKFLPLFILIAAFIPSLGVLASTGADDDAFLEYDMNYDYDGDGRTDTPEDRDFFNSLKEYEQKNNLDYNNDVDFDKFKNYAFSLLSIWRGDIFQIEDFMEQNDTFKGIKKDTINGGHASDLIDNLKIVLDDYEEENGYKYVDTSFSLKNLVSFAAPYFQSWQAYPSNYAENLALSEESAFSINYWYVGGYPAYCGVAYSNDVNPDDVRFVFVYHDDGIDYASMPKVVDMSASSMPGWYFTPYVLNDTFSSSGVSFSGYSDVSFKMLVQSNQRFYSMYVRGVHYVPVLKDFNALLDFNAGTAPIYFVDNSGNENVINLIKTDGVDYSDLLEEIYQEIKNLDSVSYEELFKLFNTTITKKLEQIDHDLQTTNQILLDIDNKVGTIINQLDAGFQPDLTQLYLYLNDIKTLLMNGGGSSADSTDLSQVLYWLDYISGQLGLQDIRGRYTLEQIEDMNNKMGTIINIIQPERENPSENDWSALLNALTDSDLTKNISAYYMNDLHMIEQIMVVPPQKNLHLEMPISMYEQDFGSIPLDTTFLDDFMPYIRLFLDLALLLLFGFLSYRFINFVNNTID